MQVIDSISTKAVCHHSFGMADHRATRNQLRHGGYSFGGGKDRHLDSRLISLTGQLGGCRLALALACHSLACCSRQQTASYREGRARRGLLAPCLRILPAIPEQTSHTAQDAGH